MKLNYTNPKGMQLPPFNLPAAPLGNPHYNIAVWGTSGTGKTAQALPILRRLSEQTAPEAPFDDALLAAIAANVAFTITLPKATTHNATDEA